MKVTKRAILLAGALAALLPLGATGVHAATITNPGAGFTTGMSSGFDRVIDLIVQQRTAAEKLSNAAAQIVREQLQLQYRSLTRAEQERLMVDTRSMQSEEDVMSAMRLLNNAVQSEARAALAEVQAAAQAARATTQAPAMQQKLGADGDLVFVATVGPCRVYDSRNGPGQLASLAARQIWGFSNVNGYNFAADQGGTGIAGSGNCTGTVHPAPASNYPVAVVATVGIVNPVTSGSMRAWNGGTTLTVGGILGWNAGDVLANTTVIPMDRLIAAYPGSGLKRDFGLFNNSGGPVDIIVDVVGYFVQNQATALDCTYETQASTNIPANSSVLVSTPACPTGYTAVAGSTVLGPGLYTSTLSHSQCRIGNLTGGALNGSCNIMCCRVPGL